MSTITAASVRAGAEIVVEVAGIPIRGIVTNVETILPNCDRCGAAEVDDAGDHADTTGHWPTAGRPVTIELDLLTDAGVMHNVARRQTSPVRQVRDHMHWCKWSTPRVAALRDRLPAGSELRERVDAELAELRQRGMTRDVDGVLIPASSPVPAGRQVR